jgi:DNA replication protein DnaC
MSSFWIACRVLEVSARVERDVTMKTRLARFPFVKTLEQFDFSFQPALNEAQIRELAAARFGSACEKTFCCWVRQASGKHTWP